MNLQDRFQFKPVTLGLLAASVLTLAALGLFATGSQAADAAKPAAEAKAALTVALTQPKSSMLTIKHVEDGGHESIEAVVSVIHDPEENLLIGCGPNRVEIIRYTSGHAFVMNDAGKTVGVYNLRPTKKQTGA